jgi:aryl-alcohol dehydrogenase-like predicted oxidoreductase
MTFGTKWGFGADEKESLNILNTFLDRGGNFIDTADRYNLGQSEEFLGRFLQGRRNEVVLATKFSMSMRDGDPNGHGNHRKHIVEAVNASLKRLQTDYIDLYWLHAWDGTTPVEEVLRALDDLVRAGKVLYIGISDTPAWIVSMANAISYLRGWTSFIGLQAEYSLIERTAERELIPMAQAMDIGLVPWAPLGGGVLTGKYLTAKPDSLRQEENERKNRLSERNLAIIRIVKDIADELSIPCTQVSLAWIRQKFGLQAPVVPIVGCRTVEQLQDSLGCLEVALSIEHMQRLEEVSKIELGFPHDFLNNGRSYRMGGMDEKIVLRRGE